MGKIYDQREDQYALKKKRAVSRKRECTCYADSIILMMHELINKADDTFWLGPTETVFDRCWMIIEREEGRERLEMEFPYYA